MIHTEGFSEIIDEFNWQVQYKENERKMRSISLSIKTIFIIDIPCASSNPFATITYPALGPTGLIAEWLGHQGHRGQECFLV